MAVAGSGKTTSIVDEALANRERRVLLTTFTNENLSQIRQAVVSRIGCVPPNITIQSWYGFLLDEGARPFQRSMTGSAPRIASLYFESIPDGARRLPRSDPRHYLTRSAAVYRERLADLVVQSNLRTRGAVADRIRQIYECVVVDEMQDLAGSDLDLLDALMSVGASVILAGDPRQATFRTNHAIRNRRYRGAAIVEWVEERRRRGDIELEERNDCYRCIQPICNLANRLYPGLPAAVSRNSSRSGHDGVFFVPAVQVRDYCRRWSPAVLRHSRVTDTQDLDARNFGEVKGRTYERVLIFPTAPMRRFLTSGRLSEAGDVSRLYVAVTRARLSVAFVFDGEPNAALVEGAEID